MTRPKISNPKSKILSIRLTEVDYKILIDRFGSIQVAIEVIADIIKYNEIPLEKTK